MGMQIIGSRLWGGGRAGAALQSHVFMTPRHWDESRERAFSRLAWRAEFEEMLTASGYSGSWDKTPWGRYGVFRKDLSGPGAVRNEIAHLAAIAAWTPAAEKGRRTTR
jgi:hypothetical protein